MTLMKTGNSGTSTLTQFMTTLPHGKTCKSLLWTGLSILTLTLPQQPLLSCVVKCHLEVVSLNNYEAGFEDGVKYAYETLLEWADTYEGDPHEDNYIKFYEKLIEKLGGNP